ncbi:unnamed protein product, partial [Meganyctiphanes norvegica]
MDRNLSDDEFHIDIKGVKTEPPTLKLIPKEEILFKEITPTSMLTENLYEQQIDAKGNYFGYNVDMKIEDDSIEINPSSSQYLTASTHIMSIDYTEVYQNKIDYQHYDHSTFNIIQGEKPYQCSQCEKSFANQSSLRYHQKHHTGEMPHQCSHCDRRFIIKSALIQHLRTHTGEKPYIYI